MTQHATLRRRVAAQPVAARLPSRRLVRMGRPGARRRGLRARRGRNGRDFDVLGEALAPTHRVLAVDMPGRGAQRMAAPIRTTTCFPTYLATLTALIAASGADTVAWVGTSMGGLLGIAMAAQPGTPVARLVVNDVGPVIEAGRAGAHRQLPRPRPGLRQLCRGRRLRPRDLRAVRAADTDAQWRHVARTQRAARADGPLAPGLRPGHRRALSREPAPPDLWPMWDAMRCPTLVLRGAQSDLLSAATARR